MLLVLASSVLGLTVGRNVLPRLNVTRPKPITATGAPAASTLTTLTPPPLTVGSDSLGER